MYLWLFSETWNRGPYSEYTSYHKQGHFCLWHNIDSCVQACYIFYWMQEHTKQNTHSLIFVHLQNDAQAIRQRGVEEKGQRKVMMRKDEHEEISSLFFIDKADEDGCLVFHVFTAPELWLCLSCKQHFQGPLILLEYLFNGRGNLWDCGRSAKWLALETTEMGIFQNRITKWDQQNSWIKEMCLK